MKSVKSVEQAQLNPISAVIPAAGIGKRMQSIVPKQYLTLQGKSVLEHAVAPLLAHPAIQQVVIALHPQDHWFAELTLNKHPKITTVWGGAERSDSVLSGLTALSRQTTSVLVHDAVRPCLTTQDLNRLIDVGQRSTQGAILAYKVVDTIKQAQQATSTIAHTVDRSELWHALTPQLFPLKLLREALSVAQQQGAVITDEASALERLGYCPELVVGNKSNIKITTPEDLALAEYYLTLTS